MVVIVSQIVVQQYELFIYPQICGKAPMPQSEIPKDAHHGTHPPAGN
jgi:hypothetical protein